MKRIVKYFLLLFCSTLFAQYTIVGAITDEANEILPYASVYLNKSRTGTVSNEQGNYKLEHIVTNHLNRLDTLVISYVGYKESRLPIYFAETKEIKLDIVLESSREKLEEVIIKGRKKLTVSQVLKKALKSVKRNYSNSKVTMNGFYREQIKEEDKWIVLNEAIIKLNYTKYPQKHVVKKGFRDYWRSGMTSSFSSRLGNVFQHSQYFPYFVNREDKVEIVASRISQNNSKYGNRPSPNGGPLDLVALDKVKFLYDFLDPKLVKKYHYELQDSEFVNNQKCYVLRFYPKIDETKLVFQALSKKVKYPLYTGSIYIEKESFAVTKIEYQMAPMPSLKIYNKHISIGKYTINYQKENEKWILKDVTVEQRKTKKNKKEDITYIIERTLNLGKPTLLSSNETINEDKEMKIMYGTNLRIKTGLYDTELWNEYEKSKEYPKLNVGVLSHLESTTSLKKQFERQNISIDSIPFPLALRESYSKEYNNSVAIEDKYHWLENNKALITDNYIKEENLYTDEIFQKVNYDRSYFYAKAQSTYKQDTLQKALPILKEGDYHIVRNKKGDVYLERVNKALKRIKVLNYSIAAAKKTNFRILKNELNTHYFAYNYSVKGEISSTLVIKDIRNEKTIDSISNINTFYWLDDVSLIYSKLDDSKRAYQIKRHNLGSSIEKDKILYEEEDVTFGLELSKSNSGQYLFVTSENKDATENYVINLEEESVTLTKLTSRQKGSFYTINHFYGNQFYIKKNGIKASIFNTDINNYSEKYWKKLYETDLLIEDFYVTKNYVLFGENVKTKLKLKYFQKEKPNTVKTFKFKDKQYYFDFIKDVNVLSNDIVKVHYETPMLPQAILNLDLKTNEITVESSIELNEHIHKKNYVYEKDWVKTQDGNKIPISIFYNKLKKEDIKGILIKTYGAYNSVHYAVFSDESIVYADAGIAVAYVHSRGNGDLGYSWYKDGKLLNKKNSFEDYIIASEYLKNKFKLSSNQMIGLGVSAGGLVMGYVANNRPNLFHTLIFDRAYLDVLNTMTNKELPLTTLEYNEWGNPNDKTAFDYIKSYSPYQNITKQAYPNMLFFSNYYDEQAPYWQITKSVAAYRNNNTSNNLIAMRTNMNLGHTIPFNELRDQQAEIYAFIIHTLKRTKKKKSY